MGWTSGFLVIINNGYICAFEMTCRDTAKT